MTNTVSKNKSIQINETELVIKKIPLRRVIALLEDISKMEEWKMIDSGNLDEQSISSFIGSVPTFVGTSFPRFAGIIAKAINQDGIDGDWLLDNVALDESIEIVETIMEVNNVQKIVEKIKKVQALAPKNPVPQKK